MHFHLHLICISCLPPSHCKNVFAVALLPCKNDFVVRHRPQEWFCGVLSPTRTIFVRGNHAPQGLLTLGWLTLIFTNSHVIIPSFGCVCVLVISGMRNVGKKFTNTFRRVTGSSSSRSSLHRSSTPTPSFTHDDEQAESQAPEEQVEHQEEEAPDDSHIRP